MSDNFGMTPEGFRIKRSEDIISEIFDELESHWGTVKRNPESVIGQLVGVLSKPMIRLWMETESLYMSIDPDSAEGVLLDNICRYKNILRKSATGTTVICTGYGDVDTVIPLGSQVSDVKGAVYSTVDNYVFTAGVYNHVELADDGSGNDVIARVVTIQSSGLEYTSTITSTFADWKAQFAVDIQNAVDNEVLPFGIGVIVKADAVDLISTGYVSFDTTTVTALNKRTVGYPLIATNIVTGENYVSAKEVDSIVTSVVGWNSVTNFSNGLTGTNIETDNELRVRRRQSKRTGSANTDSVEIAVLNQVAGVRSCRCYENTSSDIVDGLKPHSIYAVVDGADGKEQEIAEAIWKKKCHGIDTNGTISRNVIDSSGQTREILFGRPELVYGWVRVDVTDIDPDRSLPVDWASQIQSSILEVGNDLDSGDDLIASKFYQSVYSVSGVRSASIEVGTSSSPAISPTNWTNTYISIDKIEKVAIASSSNVEVTGSF